MGYVNKLKERCIYLSSKVKSYERVLDNCIQLPENLCAGRKAYYLIEDESQKYGYKIEKCYIEGIMQKAHFNSFIEIKETKDVSIVVHMLTDDMMSFYYPLEELNKSFFLFKRDATKYLKTIN